MYCIRRCSTLYKSYLNIFLHFTLPEARRPAQAGHTAGVQQTRNSLGIWLPTNRQKDLKNVLLAMFIIANRLYNVHSIIQTSHLYTLSETSFLIWKITSFSRFPVAVRYKLKVKIFHNLLNFLLATAILNLLFVHYT
jgi:hypothetical protein